MAVNLINLALNLQTTIDTADPRQLAYTATNGPTRIQQASVFNNNAGAQVFYLYILSDATLTGTVRPIEAKSIPAGESATLDNCIGHFVPQNGTIQIRAAVTNDLYFTASGVEDVAS